MGEQEASLRNGLGDFRDWYWSSYHALIGNGSTKLKRDDIPNTFGGIKGFEEFHRGRVDEKQLAELIDEEFDLETHLRS